MDRNIWLQLDEIFKYHKGKIIGGILGFVFGILILYIGLLRTLLVFLLTSLGFYIGARWDIEGDLKKLLDRLLPPRFK